MSPLPMAATRRVFVTGATGAVGSALVPRLLADPTCAVGLLIRATDETAGAARLEQLYAFWGWGPERPERHRVAMVRGDAAEPQFALTGEAYAALAAWTTDIVHCAASVRMNLQIEAARHCACGSAQAVLELARAVARGGRLGKVEMVSTVGVGGRRREPVAEEWMEPSAGFHNTYEQSKAEAEVLVRRAIECDSLPITVHRPSMVVGSSQDGTIIHHQIFYHICEFLSGRRTGGWFPRLDGASLDLIPVDRVAEAIARSLVDPATAGRILHLCSGPGRDLSLGRLRDQVRDLWRAHALPTPACCDLPRWLFAAVMRGATLTVARQHRRAIATLPVYLDYLASRQVFLNHGYATWMAGQGLQLHDTAQLVETVLTAYLNNPEGPHGRGRKSPPVPGVSHA